MGIWRKTRQLLHTVLVLTKDVQQKPWGDAAGPLRLQDHLRKWLTPKGLAPQDKYRCPGGAWTHQIITQSDVL